jgi:hypothetical protein
MLKNSVVCILAGMLLLNSPLSGFSQAIHTQNNNIWLHYSGKNMLTKKLSFTFEATFRFANGLSEKQQYFVRPSIDYQFTKHLMGSVGYSHYLTYVYGSPSLNKIPIPENHVWFQGQFVHQFGDLKITNRLRDEVRYVGIAVKQPDASYDLARYDYRNRFRYMLLMNYPLLKKDQKTTTLFGILGDELFLNVGPNTGTTVWNQNRIIAGLGYIINPHHQVQLSYIQQKIWNYTDTLEENNPTLRISYITNFSFTKAP